MQCFKYGDLVALLCQVACAGQTGRTGTDYCNAMTVGCGNFRCSCSIGIVIVRNETLQTANANRLKLDAQSTLGLTLGLLRTNTAADCRKG